MIAKPLPPLEELKEFLHYNPDTGIFTWKKQVTNSIKVGQKAGRIIGKNSMGYGGYIIIKFNYREYYAHRLGYYMYHGIDPLEKFIDHIDGDKINNKINNLRLATKSQNNMNRSILGSNNNSGYTGVGWNKKDKKWSARITIDGVRKFLGYFINIEDAIKARKEGEIKYFGEFRGRINK